MIDMMCFETSSPRASYSFEFGTSEFIPAELTSPSLSPSSNPGFEFGTHGSFEFMQSSADELFKNGTILPRDPVQKRRASQCEEAQEREVRPEPIPFLSPLQLCRTSSLGGAAIQTAEEIDIAGTNSKSEEKVQPKSFWGFRRSSSLNSETGSRSMSFLFPLPVLSRSTSVSSAAALRQNSRRRPSQKQQSPALRMAKSSSPPAYACLLPTRNYAPLLRKSRSGGTYYGSTSIKVSPVLNVPPGCTSRGGAGLFGFGCLSLWGKDKKSRE